MTKQGSLQSRQRVQTLLAQGGKVATNAAKGLSSSLAAKTPRNLLLHLDHAEIALGLVVIKRHGKVDGKAQHRIAVEGQPVQQIACRMLFASSLLFWNGFLHNRI